MDGSPKTFASTPEPSTVGQVYMDAMITPNRSLSRSGFRVVVIALTAASVLAASLFVLLGAWPVAGFFGLDIALLAFALHHSLKAGNAWERVRVSADAVEITASDRRGEVRTWRAPAAWLKVRLRDGPGETPEIRLCGHGLTVALGELLSPKERAPFAKALDTALKAARAERWPAG
ncbi:MAG: DUF2244 domain-containing protein [Maricaulaceae bacterium]